MKLAIYREESSLNKNNQKLKSRNKISTKIKKIDFNQNKNLVK
jgi:hypothetical protein